MVPSRSWKAHTRPFRTRRALVELEPLEDRCVPAAINWDGGGGDLSWHNRFNWDTDILPGTADDVSINVPASITVTHSTGTTQIRSLTCQENLNLAGGTLRVTNGASVVNGDLSISGNATLVAQGVGATWTANGPTTLTGASLQAMNGGSLHLPNATSFTAGSGNSWSANGASTLNLSGLTTITGPLSISAVNSAQVNLSHVTAISGGAVSFSVTGAATLVDLSQLVTFSGAAPSIMLVSGGKLRCANLALPAGGVVMGTGTLEGNVTNAGQIRPGLNTSTATGVVTITGDYTQSATGSLAIKLNGLTPGTQYDQLLVNGSVTLDGALTVTRPTGFVPALGNSFQVLTFASRSGDFATKNGLIIDSAKRLMLSYGASSLQLITVPLNRPPVLDPIGNRTVDEESLLTIAAHATDPDTDDLLTYSLDSGAPAGATIDPVTGVFTWTPTEAQGPASYEVTIRVVDNGTPAESDFETITIDVLEVNAPPVLEAIGDQSVNEGSLLTFTAVASDPDLPANSWSFSLDDGAPAGASIDPVTGIFTWTPTEAQGPASYEVTIRVVDNGSPAASDFETITIDVLEVNEPPVLEAIGDQVVPEGSLLTFTAVASDPDLPANSWSFSLDDGAPAGASIDPVTGIFTWTPTEAQGPASYEVTIRVVDNGSPAESDFETITIEVLEVNEPPVLEAIGDQSVNEGSLLTFTAVASDPDLPANHWSFSLDDGAPAGASIDPDTGVFTWTPGDGPSDHWITIRVTDDGSPALSDFETILVSVANVDPIVSAGTDETVPQSWPFVRAGTFSDPGMDSWTASVNYGDGAGDQPLLLNPDKTFELNHQYASGGLYTVTVTVTDDDGGEGATSFELTVLPPPAVQSVVIEDGSAQRSMVRRITVTFDTIVALEPGAFTLLKQGGSGVSLKVAANDVAGRTVATICFASGTDLPGANRSLADGDYWFTILASKVTGNLGQYLDGDGDGEAGGDHLFGFHRLFGDADGDHHVSKLDRDLFMSSFKKRVGEEGYLWFFDFDGNGEVDSKDLGQFNHRYGL